MTRRTKANVAIALLLMALTLVGCNPSTGGPGSADEPQVAIMKAVSQAMASVNTTSPESNHVTQDGNTYNVTSFTADDGSRIDGSFTTDANGAIIDANLKFYYADGTEGPTFILKTENNSTSATIGEESVNPATLPQPMTRDQGRAFGAFIMGYEEALEDVEETLDEILDDDYYRSEGKHTIRENRWGITGSVTVAPEDRWDDDMEIVAADVSFPALPIEDKRGASVSGSYSFTSRGDDNIEADINITIEDYREEDDGITVNLENVRIVASIAEGERRDDDYFSFDGSISGSFSTGRDAASSHSIEFSGSIDAMEDHYFRFPEYSLKIDGESVAIGRQARTGRN